VNAKQDVAAVWFSISRSLGNRMYSKASDYKWRRIAEVLSLWEMNLGQPLESF
jgi:hypothetical protein